MEWNISPNIWHSQNTFGVSILRKRSIFISDSCKNSVFILKLVKFAVLLVKSAYLLFFFFSSMLPSELLSTLWFSFCSTLSLGAVEKQPGYRPECMFFRSAGNHSVFFKKITHGVFTEGSHFKAGSFSLCSQSCVLKCSCLCIHIH